MTLGLELGLGISSFVPASNRDASACTRALLSNTIYWGENECEDKAETGPGVKGGGKRVMVAVAKWGSKLQKVLQEEGRRKNDLGTMATTVLCKQYLLRVTIDHTTSLCAAADRGAMDAFNPLQDLAWPCQRAVWFRNMTAPQILQRLHFRPF